MTPSTISLHKKGEKIGAPLPNGGWTRRILAEDAILIALNSVDAMRGGIVISAKQIREVLRGIR